MSRSLRILLTTTIAAVVLIPIAVMGADRFDDVPAGSIFHDDIAWMAANGITTGCNPPANTLYCPGNGVTREQMAAFMRRLAASQAVDAGSVQGMTAADLQNQAVAGYERVFEEAILLSGPESLSISCPAGKKVLSGGIDIPFTWGVMFSSYPSSDTTWTVEFNLDAPVPESQVFIWAVCATG